MDIVKTRIGQLNGTIEVGSTPRQGTDFILRLPLTLAIINSLLIRVRRVTFSLPIDDVREIVSIAEREIVSVHGKQTIDVRGEFIPLVSVDDIFDWHNVDYGRQGIHASADEVLGKVSARGDGVVTYESAHLKEVSSEEIVPEDHVEIHRHPRAILEVQRILLEHLKGLDRGAQLATGDRSTLQR